MAQSLRNFSLPTSNPLLPQWGSVLETHRKILTGENMKLSPLSKDEFVRILFTLWLEPQQKLIGLFLGQVHIPWWICHRHGTKQNPTSSPLLHKQASLSVQSSFSVLAGCFAWILCCLLQMQREKIGWLHLTLWVNSKGKKLLYHIGHNLLLQASQKKKKKKPLGSHWARNLLSGI